MKKLLFVFLTIVPAIVSAQSNYFVQDSVASVGVKMVESGDRINSRICQVIVNDKIIEYTPEQVSEYGFKNGRVYFSRKIQSGDTLKMVFLERLVQGKATLYYYRGSGFKEFFLEKENGTLESLPMDGKTEFHNALSMALSDCQVAAGNCRLTAFNKRSLSELISSYNKCTPVVLHTFKYGVIIGYEVAKLGPSSSYSAAYANDLKYAYEGSYAVGAFIDKPILYSDFSAHFELYYTYKKYSYSGSNEITNVDLVANTSGIFIPVILRYTLQRARLMPFINTGVCYAFNINNTGNVYTSENRNGTIQITGIEKSAINSKNQVGLAIGSGLEYKLSSKRSLFLELRYNNLVSLNDAVARNISGFMLLTEINF